METFRHTEHPTTQYVLEALPTNDNRRRPLAMGRSLFPEGAVARIFKPSRSATTSGKAGTKGWRLTFERRTAPFIEPLMGWTGGDDTLTQVELSFPTLESAPRYAERQGLSCTVHAPNDSASQKQPTARSAIPHWRSLVSRAFRRAMNARSTEWRIATSQRARRPRRPQAT